MKRIQIKIPILLFFFAIHLFALQGEPWQTKPSIRKKINFNSEWLFFRGQIEDDAAKNPSFDDTNWISIHLPHSPELLPLRPLWKSDRVGINWYRKYFKLPDRYKNLKIYIEFEGADKVSDVWINGIHLVTNKGAYLPFTVDITDYVKSGSKNNVLVVKVSNLNDKDIPVYASWISFGGLYRDVWLHITDRLHVTDAIYANKVAGGGIFVTYPKVTPSLTQIRVKTNIQNEYKQKKDCTIQTHLMDSELRKVITVQARYNIEGGQDHTFDQFLKVMDCHLWHPNDPYLYTLQTEIYTDDKLVDTYQTRIGIRRIQFTHKHGLLINDKPFWFMGTNRVQEYPYVVWAFPNSAQRRDAILLKEAGFQYVRSSHNPQDPAFLDACDELGVLVMGCIPGFQFIGNTQFLEYSYQNMRDMIRRDRNHPSVILWELSLNETDFDSSFARMAVQIGHEEYPGDQCFVSGWKFSSIYDVFIRATQHGARDCTQKTPLVISEYGHWDYGGGNSTSDVDRKDGEIAMLVQVQNHQESLNLNRKLPFLCGDGLWVGIDFQFFPSGVMDYFRIPKFSYYLYQSQRDPNHIIHGIDSGPMVFVANYWTEMSHCTVMVFSNCDRINLYLNGQFIASQKPDNGIFTEHLLHPPFTFHDIPFKPGELKAIGYMDNEKVASHSRRTPGQAEFIDLRFDLKGAAMANGEDMFFVYASVVDENGTIVRDVQKEILFGVTGSGILISPERVETEAGTAAALVRTTIQSGQIVIKAKTEGFKEAVASKNCIK